MKIFWKEIVIKLTTTFCGAAFIMKIKICKEHFIGNVSWGFEYLIDLL